MSGRLRAGSVVAGKYRLVESIATGGMGSVWRARHLALDHDVAVKFMASALLHRADGAWAKRFEREARAGAQLRSPHVAQVVDHGLDGDTPYLVMELLHGEDLGARLRARGELSLVEVRDVLTQAARALDRAHELGLVHRDLKPGNLFFAETPDGEILKVLDFGIAKALPSAGADETTRTGEILGSPPYMSPEQALGGKEVDHRSDLWSLAVIAYRALTGTMAFRGDGVGELIVAICTGPIPVPSHAAPELPPAIDRFFERALARAPDERFQSARAMAEAFAAVVDNGDGRQAAVDNGDGRQAAVDGAPRSAASRRRAPASDAPTALTEGARRRPSSVPTGGASRGSSRMVAFAAVVVVLGVLAALVAPRFFAASSQPTAHGDDARAEPHAGPSAEASTKPLAAPEATATPGVAAESGATSGPSAPASERPPSARGVRPVSRVEGAPAAATGAAATVPPTVAPVASSAAPKGDVAPELGY